MGYLKFDRGNKNIINVGSVRYTLKSVTILAGVSFLSSILALLYVPFTDKFPFIWPASGFALAGLMGSKRKLFVYVAVANFLVMAVSRGLVNGNWRWNVALSILEIANVIAITLILRSFNINRYIFTQVHKINLFLGISAAITIFIGIGSIFIQPAHWEAMVGLEWGLWVISILPSLWIFTPLILSYYRRFERLDVDGTIIMKPLHSDPWESIWAVTGSVAVSILLFNLKFTMISGLLIILIAIPLMMLLATRLDSMPFMIVLTVLGEAAITHVYLDHRHLLNSDPTELSNLFTAKLFYLIFSGTLIIISVLIQYLEYQKNFVFRGRLEFAANFMDSHLGMFHANLSGQILRVNNTLKNILGYTNLPEIYAKLSEDPMAIFFSEEDVDLYRQMVSRQFGWVDLPIRLRSQNDESIPVEIAGRPWMEHSERTFIEVIVTDQRPALLANARLVQSEESLRLATQSGGIGTWEERISKGEIIVNSVFEDWFPLPEDSSRYTLGSLRQQVDPAMLPIFDQLAKTIDSGYLDYIKAELRMKAEGRGWRFFNINGQRLQNSDGTFSDRWAGTIVDISDQNTRIVELTQSNQNLRRQLEENNKMRDMVLQNAVRDQVTNLFTKNYLEELIKPRLDPQNGSSKTVHLIMLEIDKGAGLLKEYKYTETREILLMLADILRQHFKSTDQIGKLKTYTFCVFTEEDDEDSIALRLNKVSTEMDAAMLNHYKRTLRLRSCRVSYPHDATTWEELIEAAEKTLDSYRI